MKHSKTRLHVIQQQGKSNPVVQQELLLNSQYNSQLAHLTILQIYIYTNNQKA